jgi:hypothetical protein
MMKGNAYFVTTSNSIHLAIDPNRLETLIREGRLNVTDFNCLDNSSKRGVWAMLRSLAASKLQKS